MAAEYLGKLLYTLVWVMASIFYNNYTIRALSFIGSVLFAFVAFIGALFVSGVIVFLITGIIQP